MDLPILIKNPALDFELCELLGEKPSDFIVLCIYGEQVPFLGTPWDSPEMRETLRGVIEWLHDRRRKDWPQLFSGWRHQFITHYKLPEETTAESFRPKFTLAVSRVCPGYSQHLHVAMGVFATLGTRLKSWSLATGSDGKAAVEMASAQGISYWEEGDELPKLIARSAVRLLRESPVTTA